MFKKIKELFQPKGKLVERTPEEIKQQEELLQAKRYYGYIRAGSEFAKFIVDDLQREGNGLNREQRRRWQRELHDKGVFSQELIAYYQAKLDWLLSQVDARLQSLNQPKN